MSPGTGFHRVLTTSQIPSATPRDQNQDNDKDTGRDQNCFTTQISCPHSPPVRTSKTGLVRVSRDHCPSQCDTSDKSFSAVRYYFRYCLGCQVWALTLRTPQLGWHKEDQKVFQLGFRGEHRELGRTPGAGKSNKRVCKLKSAFGPGEIFHFLNMSTMFP